MLKLLYQFFKLPESKKARKKRDRETVEKLVGKATTKEDIEVLRKKVF